MSVNRTGKFSLTKPVFDWNRILESDELLMDDSEDIITKNYDYLIATNSYGNEINKKLIKREESI